MRKYFFREISVKVGLAVIFMFSLAIFLPVAGHALVLSVPFGGRVQTNLPQVCLIPAPPPIFTIPIPFRYLTVGNPNPAKVYLIDKLPPGVPLIKGTEYRHYNFSKQRTGFWALGKYVPGVDDLFRMACLNAAALPNADGVVQMVGSGN